MNSRSNKSADILTWIKQQLAQCPLYKAHAESYAWWLLNKATSESREQLIAHPGKIIDQESREWLTDALHRICNNHEPIQYILGTVPFLDLSLIVEPPILIPRPETEEWVAALITSLHATQQQPRTILDLCTGSGCIALALAQEFPQAHVTGTDINPAALDLAQRNAQAHNIQNITFYGGDLYNALPHHMTFDLITANPPYIAPEAWADLEPTVRLWEDPAALIAPEHGYALINRIVAQAFRFLSSSNPLCRPQLWLECDPEQTNTVAQLFAQHGFYDIQMLVDSFGNKRVVRGYAKTVSHG